MITSLSVNWKAVRLRVSSKLGKEITSLNKFFESNWGTEEFSIANTIVKRYEIEAVGRSPLFPDVIPSLELARQRGSRVYISSMQSVEALSLFMAKYALAEYFQGILGREDVANKELQLRKIALADRVGESRNLVLIDDRRQIIERCSELGFRCILFKRDERSDLTRVVSGLYHR